MNSQRTWPRDFRYRREEHEKLPSLWTVAKSFTSGKLFSSNDKAAVDDVPLVREALPEITSEQISATWIGHATALLRISGVAILTDPVFSEKIPGVSTRITPPGVSWEELPHIDAVVISHNHYDHLDQPTLLRLDRSTPMFVGAKLAKWCRKRGFENVTELDWWESTTLETPHGPLTLDFVPAHHWSRRTPFDFCRTLWGGWVFTTASDRRVYFAGDTAYGRWFRRIGERYPGIELALMPVGAFEPRWFMRPAHVDPGEAVQAVRDVGAQRMLPIHWGTFRLSAEPTLAPIELTRKHWAEAGLASEDLWDLAIGETRVL